MEFFDVLNEDGTKTGKMKERTLIHRDGDWHASVRIYIFRKNNEKIEVLLQRRSMDKDSYPGCLDVSSAGHVDAGENFIEAAVRELNEELSIKAEEQNFEYLFTQKLCAEGVFQDKLFISNEINRVYFLNMDVQIDNIICQKSEVEEVKWLSTDEVLENLSNHNKEYCININEFKKVMDVVYNMHKF